MIARGVTALWAVMVAGTTLSTAPATAQESQTPSVVGQEWIDMNYGPFLTTATEVAKGNIAYKGISIRLDQGEGGVSAGNEFMLFDTDTLRYAAGWVGPQFLNWRSIVYDGSHQTHVAIRGQTVFSNPVGPGWGRPEDGSFEDRRVLGRDGRRYGPLRRDWGHWKGLYLHGNRVVLSYTVGDAEVLELPGVERSEDATALVRTLNIGPRSRDLILQVAHQAGNKPEIRECGSRQIGVYAQPPGMNTVPAIALAGKPMGTAWLASDDGSLRLSISAGSDPVRLKILYGLIADNDAVEPFAALVRTSSPPMDLEPLTHGGPPRWSEKIKTKVTALGPTDGPYIIETITPPTKNPYRSWMRLGAFDFFPGGKRAAVCTWMGDVWIVDGLGGEQLDEFTWQRIATGLYQPLGLKIVNDTVYVLGRDQITRLHDLNGDGETDFYENFNNDHQVTEHFHEFASGLETDAEGNFYYMKGGRHALDAVVPQHGSLLKVSKDGRRTEKLAYGFRAPNGLSITPNGSFLISDQEGHWTPANRINLVKPGGYYGYGWAYHDSGAAPATYVPPLCWIPPQFDRSPAEQLFVTSKKWGPFEGRILSLSYGTGNISLVLHEQVGDQVQGGLLYMPIAVFPTGIMRARFNSVDGQLYACGLFGWSSNRTRPGGFYRIRYTGRKVYMPSALHAIERGMVLEFTEPLDPRRAGRPGAYKVERWEYRRSANYGSKDYRLSDGSEGRDALTVESVQVSEDGKSVLLEIPDMKPCMQMRIRYRLQAVDGARLSQEIYNTIHALGDDAPYRERFPGVGG